MQCFAFILERALSVLYTVRTQEAKFDYLGPLIVTLEMVAKKIKAMKDNKSPGVDGIPPIPSMLGKICCFLEEITMWIDEGSPVDIIYLYFQKAFDNVHIKDYYLN